MLSLSHIFWTTTKTDLIPSLAFFSPDTTSSPDPEPMTTPMTTPRSLPIPTEPSPDTEEQSSEDTSGETSGVNPLRARQSTARHSDKVVTATTAGHKARSSTSQRSRQRVTVVRKVKKGQRQRGKYARIGTPENPIKCLLILLLYIYILWTHLLPLTWEWPNAGPEPPNTKWHVSRPHWEPSHALSWKNKLLLRTTLLYLLYYYHLFSIFPIFGTYISWAILPSEQIRYNTRPSALLGRKYSTSNTV